MKLLCPSLAVLSLFSVLDLGAQEAKSLSSNQWREDLTFVVEQIQAIHPDYTRRISAEDFLAMANALHAELPDLDDRQAATRLMALVAGIHDGHSYLQPQGLNAFGKYFPLRFYRFSDGIFITCTLPENEHLIGLEVLRIGNKAAEEALQLVGTMTSADNELGKFEGAGYLSSADTLVGLGIIASPVELPLILDDGSGDELELSVASLRPRNSGAAFDALHSRRETQWPPSGRGVTAFPALRKREQFYTNSPEKNSELPLHARKHSAYWFQHLPDRDAVFMQLNTVTDNSSFSQGSLREMYMRMFRFIDENEVGNFILDLRFNTGGNGDILLPFVHELIKRDHSINRSGHFYTLVGRRSFSAAVMLAGELNNHTDVILVGEPAGAPLNFFGDNTALDLPNSGMQLWVSTRYWQYSRWEDRSFFLPVEIPVEFSSSDYFAGIDPAIEAIFAAEEKRSIPALVREESAERAQAVYLQRKAAYEHAPYWQPFAELEMNNLGYDLLGQGRAEEARILLAMTAERYPQSANAWDSLGEAQFAVRRNEDALASYNRALETDPKNRNAHGQRAMIARIEAILRKK